MLIMVCGWWCLIRGEAAGGVELVSANHCCLSLVFPDCCWLVGGWLVIKMVVVVVDQRRSSRRGGGLIGANHCCLWLVFPDCWRLVGWLVIKMVVGGFS